MTARRFLDYQALLKGIWDRPKREAAVAEALRSVHLFDRKDDRIKTYSGGMKQRLGIAQTLLHLPRVLVVDEPTAGLDPNERIRFRNMLSELARDRIVIFSTHIIEDISSSCNRLAVLLEGRVRFTGTPAELVEPDPRLGLAGPRRRRRVRRGAAELQGRSSYARRRTDPGPDPLPGQAARVGDRGRPEPRGFLHVAAGTGGLG